MNGTVISLQVVNETINVGIKKFKLSQPRLIEHIDFLLLNCEIVSLSVGLQKKAMDLHFR